MLILEDFSPLYSREVIMINNFKTNVKVRKTPRNGSYNYIGLKKLLILLSRQGRVPILFDFPFSLGCSISIGFGCELAFSNICVNNN